MHCSHPDRHPLSSGAPGLGVFTFSGASHDPARGYGPAASRHLRRKVSVADLAALIALDAR